MPDFMLWAGHVSTYLQWIVLGAAALIAGLFLWDFFRH
jgi:hypothetical protein